MLDHVDAVHAAYYLFLHFWMSVVGTSEAAVRFPSAIAVGFAAAGTLTLGRQLFGLRLGIVAGLVFAILPQVTRMGAEARSYAFAIAAAVWLTVWLVSLVRHGEVRRRAWLLYGVAAAAATYLFLYLVLLVAVHITVVVAFHASRTVVRRWAEAMTVAAVCAAPILYAGLSQRGQIKFLAHRDYATAWSVLVGQWFSTPLFAALAWALIAVGALTAVGRSRRSHLPSVIVVLVWFAVPTMLLLAGNAWVSPMYNLRYLAFCTPAVALLLALGLDGIGSPIRSHQWRRVALVIGLVALLAAASPRYIAQRGPFAKDGGSDLRQTADVVAAHASVGGAIVFDSSGKPSRKPRLALDLYPQSFTGLTDVALVKGYVDRPALWDQVAPTDSISALILPHDTVWVVESGQDRAEIDAVRGLGYRIEKSFPVHRTTVYELSKE
ncbi:MULTISPECIES: glycosyltransferase family 39 protein [unclassified Leifsonia]|uniref:glycosyltransferase family 39 protein n=1 Tax=unclassified Leifsonia TaxID=2663824 RepID=UPI00138F5E07|nr:MULTISPECIES: glycosyltransferase family 39 protein [unclassified Leifsonia]